MAEAAAAGMRKGEERRSAEERPEERVTKEEVGGVAVHDRLAPEEAGASGLKSGFTGTVWCGGKSEVLGERDDGYAVECVCSG